MSRLHFEPPVPFRMMHRIDRFEEGLRRHAAGVDTERRVIGIVTHEKQNLGAELTCRPRTSEAGRAASYHGNGFSFSHGSPQIGRQTLGVQLSTLNGML